MKFLNQILGINEEQINQKIEDAVVSALYDLLHPEVEIVTANPLPSYATPGDAGADICADLWNIQEKFMDGAEVVRREDGTIDNITIHAGGHCLVPTGIYTSFPDIYEAQIRPRSGNALKYRITITNAPGTIDARYKNEWGIILDNEGDKDFVIRQGDKIAQVVFALKCQARFVQKETVEDLSGSDRGGGFGHTTE